MSGARQGHGPCQTRPSGDTENGADARARTSISPKRFSRPRTGVAERNELVWTNEGAGNAQIRRFRALRLTTLP